jgi:SpoVK/Ycf46/Vps4 family AAA+-type ATPase
VDELAKLLATRRDARVAVIGSPQAVSKYIGETEKSIAAELGDADPAGPMLVFDDADSLLGRREEIERHDGPVVLCAASLRSIPRELRRGLVVVKAP